MPFVNNQGVQIHYEVVGNGPDLVLQHGLTGSGEDWKDSGWVDKLSADFRLIIIDARGHGKSQKPAETAAYMLKLMAQDVIAVLDALDIEKTGYFGYSMGGVIGFTFIEHFADRLNAVAIGGVVPGAFNQLSQAQLAIFDEMQKRYEIGARSGAAACIEYIVQADGGMNPDHEAMYRRNEKADFQAFASYMACQIQFLDDLPDFTKTMKGVEIPALVFVGEHDELYADRAREEVSDYPNLEFTILPNLNHVECYFEIDVVAPLLLKLFKQVQGKQNSMAYINEGANPLGTAQPLPWCDYPTAKETNLHGVQQLPEQLPLPDFKNLELYRSKRYRVTTAELLDHTQMLQMARVVATSFAQNEPMMRHVRPSLEGPAGLNTTLHTDMFGSDEFGPWTRENIFYWFIRLFFLTDPTSPKGAIIHHAEPLSQSLAIVNEDGQVVGGAFNETMPLLDEESALRQDDLFITASLGFLEPLGSLLYNQDVEAVHALNNRFPKFKNAYENKRVGHHVLIARSNKLPKSDAFELVAASVERYQELGYQYMIIEASNQWTGAACETLGGVRVHFSPYMATKNVHESDAPVADVVSSPNGYVSKKDSGSMLYVIRLV